MDQLPSTTPNDVAAKILGVQRQLLGYLVSLVPHIGEAEELLQATNVVLLSKHEEAEKVENFAAWAMRVAYFEVLAYRKQRARDRHVFIADDDLLETLSEEAAERGSNQSSMVAALERCLEILSHADRGYIQRRYQLGESPQQIAADTGRTPEAIRQLMYRIRGDLLKCIRRRMAAEERSGQ